MRRNHIVLGILLASFWGCKSGGRAELSAEDGDDAQGSQKGTTELVVHSGNTPDGGECLSLFRPEQARAENHINCVCKDETKTGAVVDRYWVPLGFKNGPSSQALTCTVDLNMQVSVCWSNGVAWSKLARIYKEVDGEPGVMGLHKCENRNWVLVPGTEIRPEPVPDTVPSTDPVVQEKKWECGEGTIPGTDLETHYRNFFGKEGRNHIEWSVHKIGYDGHWFASNQPKRKIKSILVFHPSSSKKEYTFDSMSGKHYIAFDRQGLKTPGASRLVDRSTFCFDPSAGHLIAEEGGIRIYHDDEPMYPDELIAIGVRYE